jgi:hypothetical protein
MDTFKVPLIIRGEIIEDYELEFGNRAGSGSGFVTPDVSKYIRKLVNNDPASLLDLYSISLEDIYSYLEELGNRLNFEKNAGLREAFEVSCHFSNLSRPVLENIYRHCFRGFTREKLGKWSRRRLDRSTLKDGSQPRSTMAARRVFGPWALEGFTSSPVTFPSWRD